MGIIGGIDRAVGGCSDGTLSSFANGETCLDVFFCDREDVENNRVMLFFFLRALEHAPSSLATAR